MAKVIITGSGSGGAKSDDCTATKNKVLQGYTAVTQDSDDESVAGTMPERGSWNGSVAMNGSITIPEGHHSGSGKVTGPTVTQRGAWTGKLGINGKITIPQGYHNGQGYVNQSIATQGAQTITPKATSQTVSCNGKYMTGNITVSGDADLVAANIVKGKNIFNVAGSAPILKEYNKLLIDKSMSYPSTWDTANKIFLSNISTTEGYAILQITIGDITNNNLSNAWCTIGTSTYRWTYIGTGSDNNAGSNYSTVRMYFERASNGDLYYYPTKGSTSGTYRTRISLLATTKSNMSAWQFLD